MKETIHIVTKKWAPTIVEVENGYIVTLRSHNEDCEINETYVYSSYKEMIVSLDKHFNTGE